MSSRNAVQQNISSVTLRVVNGFLSHYIIIGTSTIIRNCASYRDHGFDQSALFSLPLSNRTRACALTTTLLLLAPPHTTTVDDTASAELTTVQTNTGELPSRFKAIPLWVGQGSGLLPSPLLVPSSHKSRCDDSCRDGNSGFRCDCRSWRRRRRRRRPSLLDGTRHTVVEESGPTESVTTATTGVAVESMFVGMSNTPSMVPSAKGKTWVSRD